MNEFIRRMARDPWRGWIGDKQDSVLLLQKAILKTGYGPGGIGSAALRALGASRAHIEYRRAVAETLVAASPRSGQPPTIVLSLLDASSFPKLRKLVRASSDPQTFHYGAAAALAYHGDRGILPDLEALRPAFLAHHVNTEGFLIGHIWETNIQHPPSKLLEYISSTELLIGVQRRVWAIRRAVELGLPKQKIRQAVLSHASQVKPQTKGKWTVRPGLLSLKKTGMELGVLGPDDLPGVKIPLAEPTP